MSKVKITTNVTRDGVTQKSTLDITASGTLLRDPTVAAAKTGSLTTRTDADTGVVTAAAGHGIISTDKVDVHWTGGSRANMVATVATNAITVDGGVGDNLPVQGTAVTIMKPTAVAFPVVGDDVVAILFYCVKQARVTIFDGAGTPAVIASLSVKANEQYSWPGAGVAANPLAGVTAVTAKFSHADSSASQAPELTALYN